MSYLSKALGGLSNRESQLPRGTKGAAGSQEP